MENSIIVPAYNEEKRITNFLDDLLKFSESNLKNYEIIFVDDGSTDNTLKVIKNKIKNKEHIKIISYAKNQGKGEAVRRGVLAANGEKILFIDADGSIHPNQIPILLEKLGNYDVVVGDRSSKESKIKITFLRKATGVLFNIYVKRLFHTETRDNLCGFKGFKKKVAKDLFSDLISKRWLFDVELFYKIKKRKYSLYKLPFEWEYRGESKIGIFEPFKMLFQLILLRLRLNKNVKK